PPDVAPGLLRVAGKTSQRVAALARWELGLEHFNSGRLSPPGSPAQRRDPSWLRSRAAPGGYLQWRTGSDLPFFVRGLWLAAFGDDGLRRSGPGFDCGRFGGNGRQQSSPNRPG